MSNQKPGEASLREQIDFLMGQLRGGSIDIHQFMELMKMAYGDYVDFFPEELKEWCSGDSSKSGTIEEEDTGQ